VVVVGGFVVVVVVEGFVVVVVLRGLGVAVSSKQTHPIRTLLDFLTHAALCLRSGHGLRVFLGAE